MVGQGLLLRRGDAGVGEVVPCRQDTRGESLSVSGSDAQPALRHPTAGTEVIGEEGWSFASKNDNGVFKSKQSEGA